MTACRVDMASGRRGTVLAGLLLTLCAVVAFAEERIALVVGNGAYVHMPRLANPVNDAALMARTLEAVGFSVTRLEDRNRREMVREIDDFATRLQAAGQDAVGLFFFAGHGVESNNVNYLIPLGAAIEGAGQLETGAVSAQWALARMAQADNALNIVILDACRDLPFLAASRSGRLGGLAGMPAPSGMVVAYSTAPGHVAYDGEGANSPFTEALAGTIREPGLSLHDVFGRVTDVVTRVHRDQVPYVSRQLPGNFAFYFRPNAGQIPRLNTIGTGTGTGSPASEDDWVVAQGEAVVGSNLALARRQALLAALKDAVDKASARVGDTRSADEVTNLFAWNACGAVRDYVTVFQSNQNGVFVVEIRALVETLDLKTTEVDDDALRQCVALMGPLKVLLAASEGGERDAGAERLLARHFRDAGYDVVQADDGALDVKITTDVRYEANERTVADIEGARQVFVFLDSEAIIPGSGRVLQTVTGEARSVSMFGSELKARQQSLERAAQIVADELKREIPALLVRENRDFSLVLRNATYGDAQEVWRFLDSLPGIDGVRLESWEDDRSHYAVASRYAGPREVDLVDAMEKQFENFKVAEIGPYKIVGSL